jgi:hypothetical protein
MEMGDGGAGYRALGRAAVRAWLAALALLALTGCDEATQNSAGPLGGAAVGFGVSGITANPFIGYAAGIGAQAAITALQKYLSRNLHEGEQDNIAAAVAVLQPGQTAPWRIRFDIPIGTEHGDLTVTRVISSPLTVCKEVAFTVIDGKRPDSPRGIYITSACQDSEGAGQWAQADPAVARWGFLQ